jgi:hypothetical protein
MTTNSNKIIKCDSWTETKFICENQHYSFDSLLCTGIIITTNNLKNQIAMTINYYIFSNIKVIMNNLPQNINRLTINIAYPMQAVGLQNAFKNLPPLINKIKFVFEKSKLSRPTDIESSSLFNFLFGMKIPFGCRVKIHHFSEVYDVIYTDFNDEIELHSNYKVIHKIKYRSLKMDHVPFNKNYIPLNFYVTNSLNALPLVALQYTEAKIKD